MFIKHNYLKWYRNQSKLTQNDIAFILDLKDIANVSRWEQGQRQPDIFTLLAYHLLFSIPVEHLFERQRSQLIVSLAKRIALRIQLLKENKPDGHALKRIEFLSNALNGLPPPKMPNE